MGHTVALDEVKAPAVKADAAAQPLHPALDVLTHALLRVVNVGRSCVVLPLLLLPSAPKGRIIAADGFGPPRQSTPELVPEALRILPAASIGWCVPSEPLACLQALTLIMLHTAQAAHT